MRTARAALNPRWSIRRAAQAIAERVAAATLAEIDRDDADPFGAALASLSVALAPDPIRTLATCPEIDTAAELRRVRVARFQAQGCRLLPERDWAAERAATIRTTALALARRYRDHLA